MPLLVFSDKGIYCPQAEIYIDPWKPVKKAFITHGHADHSRWGHQYYLCTHSAKPVIKYRLGSQINIESVGYNEPVTINNVRFSFHPAGHIVGSAQIRVEYKGEIWVVSGDYKVQNDTISEPFEPIKCHAFITESTFGLPVYKWKAQEEVAKEMNDWWINAQQEGKVPVIGAYALGKAQRILACLDQSIGPIFTHGAIENTNEILRRQGIKLPDTIRVTQNLKKTNFQGGIVVATPSAIATTWTKKFGTITTSVASGWMTLRGARRRRSVDRGFVLSDHADWDGLNEAIKATGAEKVFVTHGYTSIFKKWLNDRGIWAEEVKTEYEGELIEDKEDDINSEKEETQA